MNSINKNAPVICSRKIVINAGSRKVWSVMTNINAWATWQTDISYAKLNGELQPGKAFDWKSKGAKIHSVLHTVEPYKQFGWSGVSFGVFAVHNWLLTEKDGQTEVLVEESMEGLLAKLFRRSFETNLTKGLTTWMELMKNECEK